MTNTSMLDSYVTAGVPQSVIDQVKANATGSFDSTDSTVDAYIMLPLYYWVRDNPEQGVKFMTGSTATVTQFLQSNGYASTEWVEYWNHQISATNVTALKYSLDSSQKLYFTNKL